jgi:hypothetical protein
MVIAPPPPAGPLPKYTNTTSLITEPRTWDESPRINTQSSKLELSETLLRGQWKRRQPCLVVILDLSSLIPK